MLVIASAGSADAIPKTVPSLKLPHVLSTLTFRTARAAGGAVHENEGWLRASRHAS
jgi:hypothetical protein